MKRRDFLLRDVCLMPPTGRTLQIIEKLQKQLGRAETVGRDEGDRSGEIAERLCRGRLGYQEC